MKSLLVIVALVVGLILPQVGFSEDGVTSTQIVLGQSCALSGPAEALGQGMRVGLEACFAEVNAAGGIGGRTIRLISKDDGYEPDLAIANTRELIEHERVFLLIGEVGTPTSKAVVPVIEEQGIPFVGPFTGAEFLRNPFKKYVVNVRGSYYQEMEKLVEHLVDQKGFTKVACFYQNDGYGQAGLKGLEIALEKRSMEICAKGTYERNTVAVKSGLLKIRSAKPEAVVMVGAYKPCSEFIKLAKRVGLAETVFCNISFVGTEALRNELGEAGVGCIVSQVVRFPWDDSVPLVAEYQAAMKKHQPDAKIGFVSLEGYLVGKLFCETFKKIEAEPTREAFLQAVEETFDFGGVVLAYGENDHQGMDEVFLTIIDENGINPM